jgi:mono/diheme cytochrome c family protein
MTRLGRTADAAQWVVGVAAVGALLMLFTLEGAQPPTDVGASEIERLIDDGRLIYEQRCTSCHGDSGQGGQGPRLAGTVIVNYPDAADEIDIVTNGRNSMPPFALTLSEEEVAAVVTFTRFGFP